MPDQQTIIVTQKNESCMGGCASLFGVMLLVGLAVEYWYISAAIAAIAVAGGAYWYRSQDRQQLTASDVAASRARAAPPAPAGPAICANCGQATTGNFCGECGAAQTRTCSGCGQRGLSGDFCPDCGSATYQPPTP